MLKDLCYVEREDELSCVNIDCNRIEKLLTEKGAKILRNIIFHANVGVKKISEVNQIICLIIDNCDGKISVNELEKIFDVHFSKANRISRKRIRLEILISSSEMDKENLFVPEKIEIRVIRKTTKFRKYVEEEFKIEDEKREEMLSLAG